MYRSTDGCINRSTDGCINVLSLWKYFKAGLWEYFKILVSTFHLKYYITFEFFVNHGILLYALFLNYKLQAKAAIPSAQLCNLCVSCVYNCTPGRGLCISPLTV